MARQKTSFRTICLLLAAFLVALVVKVFALPDSLSLVRPEFVCLLVIYWVISNPHQYGVAFAWVLGFIQDLIEMNVWGAHALALTVVAYVCLVSWQRIRSYSIWQQAMWVFVLVGMHQVFVSWVQGLAGYHSPTHLIVLPTISSALIWPAFFWGLQRTRQKLGLNQAS